MDEDTIISRRTGPKFTLEWPWTTERGRLENGKKIAQDRSGMWKTVSTGYLWRSRTSRATTADFENESGLENALEFQAILEEQANNLGGGQWPQILTI